MSAYLLKAKSIADNLAAVQNQVTDEDMIYHVLKGLPPEYGPFRTSIKVRPGPLRIQELYSLLQTEELCIQSSISDATVFAATKNLS
ncbi:hypothetical protein BVC80_1317g16 [Macleaya cordata]|uniref:Uncharacterized protein n=1 Tax=Macleaya cordata TaxID=56857 RepID=A0A200QZ20_MACCD|nr:hypothetical protein BVC80_1317g16 [Macleaya cordata]